MNKEKPMGISQWKEHGIKYGYWDYFEYPSEPIKTYGVSYTANPDIGKYKLNWFQKLMRFIFRNKDGSVRSSYTFDELERFAQEKTEKKIKVLSSEIK